MIKINVLYFFIILCLISCVKNKSKLCGCTDSQALNYYSKATLNCGDSCVFLFNRNFYVKDSLYHTNEFEINNPFYSRVSSYYIDLEYDIRLKNAFRLKKFPYSDFDYDTFYIKIDSSFTKTYSYKKSMVNGHVEGFVKNGTLKLYNYSSYPFGVNYHFITGSLIKQN